MKISDCKTIIQTKWLNLFSTRFDIGDGKDREWMFVSRKDKPYKYKKDIADAVVIVPFIDEEHLVLLRQFRVPINDYMYEFPAGIVEANESILKAAEREITEETGMKIKYCKVCNEVLYNSPGLSDESLSFVFAKVEGTISVSNTEITEDIEAFVCDRNESKSLLKNSNNKFSAKCWLILNAFANGYNWMQ